jgi:hypothetical protein
MSFIAIAAGALLSMIVTSASALSRQGQQGTALTLAEHQLEIYRSLSYPGIRLNKASIDAIAATDPYKTASTSDATIPAGSSAGQVTDASPGVACSAPLPPECEPTQAVVGPDHRTYRVDTYVTSVTPTAGAVPIGRPIKQVTVIVRDFNSGLRILARSATTFDQSNIATG